MPSLIFDVALPADRLRPLYQGQANRLQLTSRTGQQVNLPAHHLRPFITHAGLYGCFELEYSPQGALLQLRRLESGH